MFNFLALLGWGTGSNDELFTRQELIQRQLRGISGGNAVFNTESWIGSISICFASRTKRFWRG